MPDFAASAPAPDGLSVPVLLLIFNRPESTRQVVDAIRQARPSRLYVAADGPRTDRPEEAARCAQTRAEALDGIDWPCELHTLLRPHNLGCSLSVAGAIRWFFDHEPEGIILEDDCLPHPSFFPYCQELLARYRHDSRVMHIGGNNFGSEALREQPTEAESYFFSQQVQSWGWASWRRAWQHYDFEYRLLPELRERGLLRHMYPWWPERLYWLQKFEQMRLGPRPFTTWDYQWHFTVAAQSGLGIVPAVNLVRNIGFGLDATHTMGADQQLDRPARALAFPLHHPPTVLRDWPRDRRHFREFLANRVRAKVQRLWRQQPKPAAAAAAPPAPASTTLVVAPAGS